MTLCAAAIASDSTIVTVSDTLLTGGTTSSDGCTAKMEPFAKDWIAMFSADDIGQCLPIIERARDYFSNRANTVATARNAFKRAYQRHLVEMKTDAVLAGYGLDMKTFLTSGKRRFTEKVFNDICGQLEATKAGCDFLVFGFDGSKRPHIFKVSDPGTDCTFDKPGFCCIGSGAYAADAILHYFEQTTLRTLSETVFNLCAAKFMAERSGIGKDTYLFIKRPGTLSSSWTHGMLEDVRRAWETSGVPRVPNGILQTIERSNIQCF